jgi:hypothetical protein
MDASALMEAANIAGGIDLLGRRLRVPKKQLRSWIDGDLETPHAVLLRAVRLLRDARGDCDGSSVSPVDPRASSS